MYGLVPHGPLDLATTPNKTQHHGEAIDFIINFQDVHTLAQSHLYAATTKYKLPADAKYARTVSNFYETFLNFENSF